MGHQEYGCGLAGCLWIRVSHEVAVKMAAVLYLLKAQPGWGWGWGGICSQAHWGLPTNELKNCPAPAESLVKTAAPANTLIPACRRPWAKTTQLYILIWNETTASKMYLGFEGDSCATSDFCPLLLGRKVLFISTKWRFLSMVELVVGQLGKVGECFLFSICSL